ncbi:MAG: histidine kinase dimerization/phospho-acceptor domain-containing protein, partial [Longimicrobiaceae bacterium]
LCTPGDDGVLRCEVGTGGLAGLEGDVLPLEGTFEGEAFLAGEARTTANLRADPRAFLAVHRGLPNTPAAALPLVCDGAAEGVALLARRERGAEFAPEELETLEVAAALVAGALRNFAEVERLRASRAVVEAWHAARAQDEGLAKGVLRAVRHELNTPVAVIRGHLQLSGLGEPGELWEAIRTQAARLEELSRLLHALEENGTPVLLDDRGRFVPPK